jgi:manganese/zinc/iron transport system substrate-binding protein
MKHRFWVGVLFVMGLLGADARAESPPLRVVATVGMVADIVRAVGGDRVEVAQLIGSGIDPHLYKPTRSDVAQLLGAQVVFYSGMKLEGKMGDTLNRIARNGREVHAVTEALADAYALRDPADAAHLDPHVWMDVQGWIAAVGVVADVLARVDAGHADAIRARADAYVKELRALDDYARSCAASIPEGQRLLVTAHDAFHYFGRAYGIEVRGIQGISTESEAGLEDINRLVDLLVARKVPAIFVESSVADRNVRALVEGARARGHDVRIGGTLFSDAMGAPGTYEGTYIGMIDHNVTLIARALGGTAPERGLQGKLGGAP